ncbi:hypothetical protein Hanom_Chr14g01292461 [Helianthus anomalus]
MFIKTFIVLLIKSKLLFWSLWFGHFCHFSPKLKLFALESLWFQFCCHFGPNRTVHTPKPSYTAILHI